MSRRAEANAHPYDVTTLAGLEADRRLHPYVNGHQVMYDPDGGGQDRPWYDGTSYHNGRVVQVSARCGRKAAYGRTWVPCPLMDRHNGPCSA